MSRTLSSAAASGLAVLSLILATTGSSPEAAELSRGEPVDGATAQAAEQDPLERRRLRATIAPAQASAESVPRGAVTPALSPALRPITAYIEPPGRPQARTFWAKGPLVALFMDPAFGPELRPDDLLVPDPPPRLAGAGDLLCIAVAIYHEARDQPLDGQLAVASVILNRTRAPDRWGASPCEVVTPGQFSFLSSDGSYPPIDEEEAWAIAVEMAREALERGPSTLVGEADHYHTPAVDPVWNAGMEQVIQIEGHIFFVDPMTQG